MPAEVLVEAVLSGDVDGEAVAAPAGPSPHLLQRRGGPGKGDADRRVELADVDPELQRAGRDHAQQISRDQVGLDLPSLGRRVPGPVRGDALGECGPSLRGQALGCELADQLDPAPALEEADRPDPGSDQVGEEVGRLCQRGSAGAGRRVDQWRVPDDDLPLRPWCAVPADQLERAADQPFGQIARVRDRRGGKDEARVASVCGCDAAQPADHVGDVRAEHPAVGVGLVDDDPLEVCEEIPPAPVVGQDSDVEHVGVAQHEVASPAYGRPLVLRRIAVVDRVAEVRRVQGRQGAGLVLSERLGRVQVERPALRITGDRVENRQVEGERLARSRGRGHHHSAAVCRLEGVGLVAEQGPDARCPQRPGERRLEPPGQRYGPALPLRLVAGAQNPAVAARGVEGDRPRGREQRISQAPHRQLRRPGPRAGSLRRSGARPVLRPLPSGLCAL